MKQWLAGISSIILLVFSLEGAANTRLKELARVEGVRDNPVVGYGIVVGLSGTGDSSRSKATLQSVANALAEFGIRLNEREVHSRNVAAAIVTAKLPPFASEGDYLDVSVSSMGDARSLVGGTLLLTPLKAANGKVYALAQGQVSTGAFQYDLNGNLVQKNHTTVGRIPNGAQVEKAVNTSIVDSQGKLHLILKKPDFTTADRVVSALRNNLSYASVRAVHAGKIEVSPGPNADYVSLVRQIENTVVNPDRYAVVVINERTGTVVSGGDVAIDDITISHGNLKVVITTDYNVSQPSFIGRASSGVASVVAPDTDIKVNEGVATAVDLPKGTSISDLVAALRQIKTSTRDVIVILQAIKSAGALNADLLIQ
ncbi:MAG: flagellar basal body P-ring protein FlgI [Pseudomonadales bacterium]|nr:flagellar basal body P-ring protein FlgI [Pseudomonadales bacterium]